MRSFIFDYSKTLADAIGADFRDNYDCDRFGSETKRLFCMKEGLRQFLAKVGLASAGATRRMMDSGLRFVEPHVTDLEWLYGKLADEESRRWLVSLAAYRALGYRKIKLSTNAPEFWEARDLALQIPCGSHEIDPQFLGWKLHERSLELFGYPIRMFCGAGACYPTFVHEQYRCETPCGPIECKKGDYVVDGGGCWGDTALYFAHKTGPCGRVATFEFLPANLRILKRNLEMNPELAGCVRVYESPIWSRSAMKLHVVGNGPSARVVSKVEDDANSVEVQTLRIDDLVQRGDLPRIDFIKMDIEGAELEALRGASSVLRDFKPQLAITVYHDFKDAWTIPQYLDSLDLGYRFYIRHFTIHAEETVLFAAT